MSARRNAVVMLALVIVAATSHASNSDTPEASTSSLSTSSLSTSSPAPPGPWLELTNTHTGEVARVTFKSAGRYDQAALTKLQHVLRDHRRDANHEMDPALYDLLFELAQSAGQEPRYEIISGYRSPESNAELRAKSKDSGVAERSLHMQGKAIDVRLKGYPTASLREAALRLGRGGVGYYDRSNFVHVDTGKPRHWEGH